MYESFKKMPTILKFLTLHALVSILLVFAVVIPGIPIAVNGQQMSYSELWSSGFGIFGVFLGLAFPLCGWLLLKRAANARLVYLVMLTIALISPYIFSQDIAAAIFGIVITGLVAGYLYITPSVRAYFASNKALQPTAESGG